MAELEPREIRGSRTAPAIGHVSEAALEALAHEPLVVIGADCHIQRISSEFERLVGVEAREAIGRPPPWPWWPPEHVATLTAQTQLIATGRAEQLGVDSLQQTFMHADGTRIRVVRRCLVLDDEQGRRLAYVAVFAPAGEERASSPSMAARLREMERGLQSIARTLSSLGVYGQIAPLGVRRDLPELASVSAREWDVLNGLLEARSTAEIGEELSISVHTVRNHTRALFEKLGVHSHLELLRKLRFSHDRPSSH